MESKSADNLTVLLPTFNCTQTVRECLDSVKWANSILVVDSYSTDDTLDICREYTNWIVQHEYITSAKQKNWAMELVRTEWVLQIDSDEYLEPGLQEEIQQKLAIAGVDGYQIPRKNLIWGKWVSSCGIYPDYQLRLFRAAKGRWTTRDVHAHITGLEVIEQLEHHLVHHDITDVGAELRQFSNQVVEWEFNELIKKGKRWHLTDVTLRPLAIFLLTYFRYGGFREGFRGFYLSIYRAFYSFMVYSKLFEDEIRKGIRK